MEKPSRPFRSQITQSFEAKALKKRSFGVRFADDLTSLFGSILFLIINATAFVCWILINTGKVPSIPVFDPFPFSMLTTLVSLEAIILTVIVLMSQNRQSLISSMREEIDIQVNLIAEREITKILKLLTEYMKVKGIKIEDSELEDMLKEIDASYIERSLEKQLTTKSPKLVESVTKPIMKVGEEVEKVTKEVEKAILPK
ncbi:hypothetical protein A3A75_02790 [Candidatus Woesebacteria bacterium RIFCSPLOWO2_01_FULL_39_10]|uniref:DUF1003 domain-containing protein n=1 Tax=Candidatus Woesebacteria bacterium RIFCSPLOWO2_01_FULL_39_10 TaxID=1802516 RepID=A0A1F8BAI7_9BACT|nr:MAG: hypothetical protein A3A75_02790 [Candidatus Woesebacteria bacterium RIFCSPLOWO2_01_FULL_39_10]